MKISWQAMIFMSAVTLYAIVGLLIIAIGGYMIVEAMNQPAPEPIVYTEYIEVPVIETIEVEKIVEIEKPIEITPTAPMELVLPTEIITVTEIPLELPTCNNYVKVTSRARNIIQGSAWEKGHSIYDATITFEVADQPDSCILDGYTFRFIGDDPFKTPPPIKVPYTLPGQSQKISVWKELVSETMFIETYLADANGEFVPLYGEPGVVTKDGTVVFIIETTTPFLEDVFGGSIECGPGG